MNCIHQGVNVVITFACAWACRVQSDEWVSFSSWSSPVLCCFDLPLLIYFSFTFWLPIFHSASPPVLPVSASRSYSFEVSSLRRQEHENSHRMLSSNLKFTWATRLTWTTGVSLQFDKGSYSSKIFYTLLWNINCKLIYLLERRPMLNLILHWYFCAFVLQNF
jgi:hypothetical protein